MIGDIPEDMSIEQGEKELAMEESFGRELAQSFEQTLKQNGHDVLCQLVVLQRANGSFELGNRLAYTLKKSLSDLRSHLESFLMGPAGKIEEEMWATALALTFLAEKLRDIAEDWQMVADKSKRWLHAQSNHKGPDSIDTWLDKAKLALA